MKAFCTGLPGWMDRWASPCPSHQSTKTWAVDPDGGVDYFPFEEAAIETIASQLTEITPRKIVTTMQQVIEEVRLAGHDPTEGLVSVDFLDQHEIVEEVLGEGGVA